MDIKKASLALHKEKKGKIEVISKVSVKTKEDLSLAYSPGVAEPCIEIHKNKETVYDYTSKGNMVAVITDGSAVLGLGNIGPEAALPVMEGKAILFKEFANVDAFPICLNTQDPDEIINICKALAPSFGGINLEDISAPNCVIIQETLDKILPIPVFHDDQDGTAIVTLAALINSAKLAKKSLDELKVVICGLGAAGSSIAKLLNKVGVKALYGYDLSGPIHSSKLDGYNHLIQSLIKNHIIIDKSSENPIDLEQLVENTDVFIGVSTGNILTESMVKKMNDLPIIFAMANPNPEILPNKAKNAGAFIIGTGRSDYPNQINNVLAFPGIFRGALDARISTITDKMKIAAAYAIANTISEDELSEDYIIPSPFYKSVVKVVSEAIKNN